MKIKELIKYLYQEFPAKDVCIKDYIGKQFGNPNMDIKNILLCLDLEKDSLEFALNNDVNLIISHHPFFFGKKKKILKKYSYKNDIYNIALKNNITLYSFHTNFDNSSKGMNTAILYKLNLKNIHSIKGFPCLAVGELDKEMDVNEFKTLFETKIGYKDLNLLNYGSKKIKTIGLIGGAGSEGVIDCKKLNIDLFISGDVPHHIRRAVIGEKLNYLDVPHEIENTFQEVMKRIISNKYPELNVLIFKEELLPYIK